MAAEKKKMNAKRRVEDSKFNGSGSTSNERKYRGLKLTEEMLAEDPRLRGLFPAANSADIIKLRELMKHIVNRYKPRRPADRFVDPNGDTCLILAIQHGHKEMVNLLIDIYKANVNAIFGPLVPEFESSNIQPLHLAIISLAKIKENKESDILGGHRQDIVIKLIEAGADVNAISVKGTPLMLTLNGNCIPREEWGFLKQLTDVLLEHGADPNLMGKETTNCSHPLNGACFMAFFGTEEWRLEVIDKMLDQGADPGMYAPGGGGQISTPLLNAATRRQWQVVELLLTFQQGQSAVNNALIDVTTENGCTPLFLCLNDPEIEGKHNAARHVVSLLLRHGANIHIPNTDGIPAYHGLEVMKTPKMQALKVLVDAAPTLSANGDNLEEVHDYWASDIMEEWIGNRGDYRGVQCPVCLIWRDDKLQEGADFSMCSGCATQCYCSRDCQVLHWPIHKLVCGNEGKRDEEHWC